MLRALPLLLTLWTAGVLSPTTAAADLGAKDGVHGTDAALTDALPHHTVGALKFISMTLPSQPDRPVWFGPGALFEVPVLHGLLEVEVAAAVLFGAHATEVPVDVVLKVPYHFSQLVDVFVGAGPMVAWSSHGTVGYGGIVTAGGYLWTHGDVGLLMEVDYTVVAHHTDDYHGVEAAAGVAMRF